MKNIKIKVLGFLLGAFFFARDNPNPIHHSFFITLTLTILYRSKALDSTTYLAASIPWLNLYKHPDKDTARVTTGVAAGVTAGVTAGVYV